MKDFWKNIQFSKTERKAIIFITAVILIGFSVKFIKYAFSNSSKSNFDYSAVNSSFKKGYEKLNLTKDSIYYDTNVLKQSDSLINEDYKSQEEILYKSEDSLKKIDPQKKKSKKEEKLQGKKINLNSAPKEELMLLPGVGESMAEKIILYRQEHKGFKKIEDIMKVKGIGKKKFEKMKEYLIIE